MITVMLVDEQDFVRVGMQAILSSVGGVKVVAQTAAHDEAIKLAHDLCPHVIIQEIRLPTMLGIDTMRKMLRDNADARILVLSNNDDAVPSLAFQAGAAGFMNKQAHADELIRAVRVVSAGQRYLSSEVAQKLAFLRVDVTQDAPFKLLSEREMQIAMMLLHGQNVPEIAEELKLSPKTVHGHHYHIFAKLQIKSDVDLLRLAVTHGLIQLKSKSSEQSKVVL